MHWCERSLARARMCHSCRCIGIQTWRNHLKCALTTFPCSLCDPLNWPRSHLNARLFHLELREWYGSQSSKEARQLPRRRGKAFVICQQMSEMFQPGKARAACLRPNQTEIRQNHAKMTSASPRLASMMICISCVTGEYLISIIINWHGVAGIQRKALACTPIR